MKRAEDGTWDLAPAWEPPLRWWQPLARWQREPPTR